MAYFYPCDVSQRELGIYKTLTLFLKKPNSKQRNSIWYFEWSQFSIVIEKNVEGSPLDSHSSLDVCLHTFVPLEFSAGVYHFHPFIGKSI